MLGSLSQDSRVCVLRQENGVRKAWACEFSSLIAYLFHSVIFNLD